ncbi:MAG: hypothetical protein LBF85_06295 [Tannerella sp.]|nr:hypothetical protein [Tannerella sp.]
MCRISPVFVYDLHTGAKVQQKQQTVTQLKLRNIAQVKLSFGSVCEWMC